MEKLQEFREGDLQYEVAYMIVIDDTQRGMSLEDILPGCHVSQGTRIDLIIVRFGEDENHLQANTVFMSFNQTV